MNAPKLQAVNLRKEYPGTVALEDVSVDFEGGKVHAIVGKNGAGKSTLVKVLAGAVRPTGGSINVDGEEVKLKGPADAFDKGISTVYQELSIVGELTVGENIFLGRLPRRKGLSGVMVDWPRVFHKAKSLLEEIQVELDVRRKAGSLGVAQQQMVEIAKAMSFNPSAILFDEPTSALARHETENLFELIRKLAARGVAIVYITHRLNELWRIAELVTVLRDGKKAGTVEIGRTEAERIGRMMFGSVCAEHRAKDLTVSNKTILEVMGLSKVGHFEDVSFKVYAGEVLGIGGTLGAGRTELLKAIFGAEPADAGEVLVEGRKVDVKSPEQMKRKGIAFLPENRKDEGLVQSLSTRSNICMAALRRIGSFGFLSKSRETAVANNLAGRLGIQTANIHFAVSSLSGGNQQKVVFAKWLNTDPRVLLLDEPTRGIDVQAKQQIFELIWQLSRRGISSVFVSSELEEIIEVCHRILVMKRGRITDCVKPAGLSADRLFVLCSAR